MSDIAERAKAAMEEMTPGFWIAWADNPFYVLVPELVAEIERLREVEAILFGQVQELRNEPPF